jgi:hypothetical protein
LIKNTNVFSQESFNGKITYKYDFPPWYGGNIEGPLYEGIQMPVFIVRDSIIEYVIKNDSLFAKQTDVNGGFDYYVTIGDSAFLYDPSDSLLMDYKKFPNSHNYQFVRKHNKKEEILGYKCTKYEYRLGTATTVFFWVANDIDAVNYGSWFNFTSNQGKLVLKKELIYGEWDNVYEAISIEKDNVTEKDFQLPPMPQKQNDE